LRAARATAAFAQEHFEEAVVRAYSAPVPEVELRDTLATRLGAAPDWVRFGADPARNPDPEAFYRADRGQGRAAGLELLERRCRDDGDLDACVMAALVRDDRQVPPRDTARELFQHACDGGQLTGCQGLAYCYDEGTCADKDPAKAAQLYDKACRGGNMQACADLGFCHDEGTCTPKDPEQARQLYSRACDGGNTEGCALLGSCTKRGTCGPQDLVRAGELFRKACDAGDMFGCNDLGVCHRDGTCAPRDARQARVWFTAACKSGLKEACASLAAHP
jgi:TPR repeat protein